MIFLIFLIGIIVFCAILFWIIKITQYNEMVIGIVIGAVVWWADCDFLLNPGGPETQISDTICDLFGVEPWGAIGAFFPLIILMATGFLGGFLLRSFKKSIS